MDERRAYRYAEFVKSRPLSPLISDEVQGWSEKLQVRPPKDVEAWDIHYDNCKTMIREAAELSHPGKAIVFGTGYCNDIPLQELAERFQEVTLVDVDPKPVHTAVQALPEALQAKVAVEIEDVSGLLDLDPFIRLLEEATTPTQFAELILRQLPTLRPNSPDFGSDYDFVCSNLLASQLFANLEAAWIKLARTKFPNDNLTEFVNVHAAKTGRAATRDTFMASITGDHLDLLSKAARHPNGVIHFADTFEFFFFKIAPTQDGIFYTDYTGKPFNNPQLTPVININPESARRFLEQGSVSLSQWEWVKQQPQDLSSLGFAYNVRSFRVVTQ